MSNSRVESHNRAELRNRIISAATLLEILLSGLVLIGLLLSMIPLLQWMPGLLFDGNDVEVSIFLQRALDIVIGIEFIKMLDMVVPGFAANETLLYSPELKFYSNKVKMDADLDTNIKGLHCLGDSSGWTRGLMMASVMGVLMGRKLAEKEGC